MNGNWFIALAVPAQHWFTRIPEPPPRVRLFDAEDLHMTVAFLGPCGQQAAENAFELAPGWPTPAVDVTLGAVRPMGNPRRPTAFSTLVDDGASILSQAILSVRGEMCERAGAPGDDRPPLPHVTIARPARAARGAELSAAIAWARGIELGHPHMTLTRLALYSPSHDRGVRLFREHAVHELDER